MVTQDLQTRDNLILGILRKILIPINDQLQLLGKTKGKELTAEEIINQPPPARQEPPAKVNLIRRERPSQIWELSDTEMS